MAHGSIPVLELKDGHNHTAASPFHLARFIVRALNLDIESSDFSDSLGLLRKPDVLITFVEMYKFDLVQYWL